MDNCEIKNIVPSIALLHNYKCNGEYSTQTVNNSVRTHNNVDDKFHIQSYEDRKISDQYGNEYLSRNVDEHDLFKINSKCATSIQCFSSKNADSNFYIKTRNCASKLNIKPINCKCLCEGNKAHKVVMFKDESIRNHTDLVSNEKLLADKTTYCRPILSFYNQEFLFKTMERNARLKRVVKKLAIARQRERDDISWNNFINELKNKHCLSYEDLHQMSPIRRESEQYITPDVIDDVYSTRFSRQQSRLCKNLLNDFYSAYNVPQSSNSSQRACNLYNSLPYDTDSYCYPTSSQGRLIVLEKEKRRNQWFDKNYGQLSRNSMYDKRPLVKKCGIRTFASTESHNKANSPDFFNCIYSDIKNKKSSTIQTDSIMQPNKENVNNNITRAKTVNARKDNKLIQVVENAEKNIYTTEYFDINNYLKQVPIGNIEKKLETLIDCINIFINEIRSNKKSKRKVKCASVTCDINNDIYKKLNMTRSDTVGMMTTDKIFCDVGNDSSGSTLTLTNLCPNTLRKRAFADNIFNGNEKLSSKDILLNNQPCSVQITFEVPNKDCATEVTKSLSKQSSTNKNELIKEMSTSDLASTQQMTIAVNTDPLSFLSLLRISTETLKSFLSYMPNIAYYSYLYLLQFPQSRRNIESQYICNICGGAFNTPSQLSDHIQIHNLGKMRDCCVCHHVLNINRRNPHLYSCQFCGQRFTRAYCCELHQKGCARRLGQRYDVASSLMLLR